MKAAAWQQYKLLVGQGLRAELADRERIISPVLFAVTMLLLFAFAVGEVDPSLKPRLYLAQTFLTAFFALQISFSRLFEPDRQDRVFDLVRTYPVSHTAWFLAKYTLVMLLGGLVLAPTLVFGAFLHQTAKVQLFSWSVCGIAFLALAGLAALGVLLSAMTLKANARQIIYPLLYFPLTTPVLLAAVQASLLQLEPQAAGPGGSPSTAWLGLLAAFDVIYFTLGILLFTELVDDG
jgi:heme exporter protein B